MSDKYVYQFSEGNKNMKDLLGGKGANLAEMTRIGLPVPPGFTITTEVCNYYSAERRLPGRRSTPRSRPRSPRSRSDTGKTLRRRRRPAARLSVRSGARASHAGHDGHDPQPGPQRRHRRRASSPQTGNPRFAYDCYRRFVTMYGDVVLGCKPEHERRGATPSRSASRR